MRGSAGWIVLLCMVLICTGTASGRNIPSPKEYGKVIMNNYSVAAGLAPVQFDHWLHRARYTCRLCHVDIGFGMEANSTKVKADMNEKGFYCGTCHNGTRVYKGEKIFPSCSSNKAARENTECGFCHSVNKTIKKKYEYTSFTKRFPKQILGNLVDWEEAEAKGLIRPIDSLSDVAAKRPSMKVQKDFSIASKGQWMPDIIFSHKKHAEWNGCELCHPDIFPSVKKGTVKYSMFQIDGGQYCGACHNTVAFPLNDCNKCHKNPVGR